MRTSEGPEDASPSDLHVQSLRLHAQTGRIVSNRRGMDVSASINYGP